MSDTRSAPGTSSARIGWLSLLYRCAAGLKSLQHRARGLVARVLRHQPPLEGSLQDRLAETGGTLEGVLHLLLGGVGDG